MIVGQDLLQALGILLKFSDQTFAWGNAVTTTKNYNSLQLNDDLDAVDDDT